jgi:hypothetical protein
MPPTLPCPQLTESQELYNPARQGPILSEQEMVYISEGSEAYAPHSRGARRWAEDEAGRTPADSFAADDMAALMGGQQAAQAAQHGRGAQAPPNW